ncbi:hypothetical protein PIB30_094747 [Stylosanthes scabra]|uniref:Uncharacterized protein n=1 Tax=Stylosanthes scabra TaxID=79078 RepID=A0ABU6QY02_9FABA|nr:hypothetical protein [Stylosanthes scabra]
MVSASEFASSQETPPRYDPNRSPIRPLIREYDPSEWPPFPHHQPSSPEHKPASSPKAEAPPPYDPKGNPLRPIIREYDPSEWPTNLPPRSLPLIGDLSQEERQEFLERARPLYLLAMEHYNDKLKEGEEKYQVIFSIQGEFNLSQGFCGFLRKMLWKAQPKSIEKIDISATKYFCGAVHEISPLEKHVSYSEILSANPLESGLTPSALPTRCDICDLKNEDDFRRKDQDLRDQWKKYNDSISLCKWEKPKGPPVVCGGPIFGRGHNFLNRKTPSSDSNRYEGGVMEDETTKKKAKFEEGSERDERQEVSVGKPSSSE